MGLGEYVEHYNRRRPHRSLHDQPPEGAAVVDFQPARAVARRTTCNGLINEYTQAV